MGSDTVSTGISYRRLGRDFCLQLQTGFMLPFMGHVKLVGERNRAGYGSEDHGSNPGGDMRLLFSQKRPD